MKKCLSYIFAIFVLAFGGLLEEAQASSTLKLLFGGDTYFGESYEVFEAGTSSQDEPGIYRGSTEGLSALTLGAHWSMVNLEAPLTLPIPNEAVDKPILHWANPDKSASTLKSCGIKAVSLANNHTMDYGPKGLSNTLKTLDKWQIERIGAGLDEEQAMAPLIKTFELAGQELTLVVLTGYHYRKSYDEKHRFYAEDKRAGVALLDVERTAKRIEKLRKKFPNGMIVVFPHWGKNYEGVKKSQIKGAHKFIESGADLVLGHGPHMLQAIERYKGKWIVYSLGNFVFNTPGLYQSRKNAYPYSFVALIEIESKGKTKTGQIKLYPILSDNKKTNFHPRLVTKEEFTEVLQILEYHGKSGIPNLVRTGKDSLGHFLTLPFYHVHHVISVLWNFCHNDHC